MYGKLRLDGIRTLLNDACPSQMPGYGWSVVVEGRPTARGWGGSAVVEPEVHPVAENTLFDLASLTKPLATALIALMAHDSGELSLFEPLPATGPGPPTPLQLLRHEGGFPPWLPLYAYAGNEDEAFQWLLHSCPREPAGLKVAYSCLGYILLGLVLEKRLNASLPELFKSRVLDTLGLASDEAFFSPGGALLKRCAATELAGSHEAGMARQYGAVPPPFQNGVAWGEVHDGNARFLGGAAGNAGLFATLGATEKLCCAYRSGSRLLSTETFRLAWTSENAPSGFRRTAGWKASDSKGWWAGDLMPPGSIGHEGFTGTGAWLEPEGKRIYILLTNRIHPSHPGTDFGPLRAAFVRAAGKVK